MMFNINASYHSTSNVNVSTETFIQYLHAFKCNTSILNDFMKTFGSVEVLESHGKEYFKIRIPKDEKLTLGYMYGFIEDHKEKGKWGIKEYSVS